MKRVTSYCPLLLLLLLALLTPEAASSPQRQRPGKRIKQNILKRIIDAIIAEAGNSSSRRLTCPEQCEETFRPVCGSDTKVYRNECALRSAACRDTNIKKVNDGPCVRPLPVASAPRPPSPCKEECTKIHLPVCGSNGVTYNNKCIMEAESCVKRQADSSLPVITLVHDGPCATHRCQEQCSPSYQPVCGTDGETYHNKCEMKVATCLSDNVRQRYEGVCAVSSGSGSGSRRTDGLRPSLDLASPSLTPQASVVSDVDKTTNCNNECSGGFRPVCGKDGVTYKSDCHLSCMSPHVAKEADGVCSKDCTLTCDEDVGEVCGTNGRTYKNICYFIVARCKDKSIQLASNGACVAPPRRAACDLRCTNERKPVCGSDGATYDNACWLEYATCTFQGLIKLYDGRCRL